MNNNSNNIFWLASYPKSGNTWFRIFLTCLLSNNETPLDINNIGYGQKPNRRQTFDEINGFSSTSLSIDEINQIRPTTLTWLNKTAEAKLYFKTHAAYTYNQDLTPVLGSTLNGVAGAIYFIRNPLDVCISYANQNNYSIDESINLMANNQHRSHCNNTGIFIPEDILSWSEHVNSWANTKDIPVTVIRYEDMLDQAMATFTNACHFLGLEVSTASIKQALANCQFDRLQALEKTTTNFSEKPKTSEKFFRKGIAGDWVQTLSAKQIDRVINTHFDVMQNFGYIDKNQNPKVR